VLGVACTIPQVQSTAPKRKQRTKQYKITNKAHAQREALLLGADVNHLHSFAIYIFF
jgi:hypothetical protein